MPAVAELLCHLTGAEPGWNRDYLRWKYLDNPFSPRPLGFVAVVDGDVVGFRGFHATPWQVGTSGCRTLVLSPGDTVVHPSHRRRGLSLTLGRAAMRRLHPEYRIFLNLTANALSLPGYLRLGFRPLEEKSRLTLIRPLRWVRASLRSGGAVCAGLMPGEYGDIVVSPQPVPVELARVGAENPPVQPRLFPAPDERFFRWYVRAPGSNHLFCYARNEGRIVAYVVLRMVDSGQHATIIDYSGRDFPPVAEILRFLARSSSFATIGIYRCTPGPELTRLLHALGFREPGVLQRAKRRRYPILPMLVRAVREDPEEEDWLVEGLDIRETSSWDIREIRSDAI